MADSRAIIKFANSNFMSLVARLPMLQCLMPCWIQNLLVAFIESGPARGLTIRRDGLGVNNQGVGKGDLLNHMYFNIQR